MVSRCASSGTPLLWETAGPSRRLWQNCLCKPCFVITGFFLKGPGSDSKRWAPGLKTPLRPQTRVKMLLPQQLAPFPAHLSLHYGTIPGPAPAHVPIGLTPWPTETSAPCCVAVGPQGWPPPWTFGLPPGAILASAF